MATAVSIAIRKSEAQARIQKASTKLAKAYGMDAVNLAPTSKQPDIEAALVLEAVADFLEQLVKAELPTPTKKVETLPAEPVPTKTVKPAKSKDWS